MGTRLFGLARSTLCVLCTVYSAQNNGRSLDIVRPFVPPDRSTLIMPGHIVQTTSNQGRSEKATFSSAQAPCLLCVPLVCCLVICSRTKWIKNPLCSTTVPKAKLLISC